MENVSQGPGGESSPGMLGSGKSIRRYRCLVEIGAERRYSSLTQFAEEATGTGHQDALHYQTVLHVFCKHCMEYLGEHWCSPSKLAAFIIQGGDKIRSLRLLRRSWQPRSTDAQRRFDPRTLSSRNCCTCDGQTSSPPQGQCEEGQVHDQCG
nr:hypothecial protein [Daphne virus X]